MASPNKVSTGPKILLIADDEDDHILLQNLLSQCGEKAFSLDWTADPEDGLAKALERHHDVLLVNYRLGTSNGLDLIRKIVECGGHIPSILLSGEGPLHLAVEALQSGAADYLAKEELDPILLERSILYAIARKRAEEGVRASEERFRTLANAVPVLIWMAGRDNGCTFVNQSWVRFRGTTLSEELEWGWTQGVHPEDNERLLQTCAHAIAEQSPFKTEFRLRRDDGEYRWMLDTGTCVYHADGSFAGLVRTCIDITDQKIASEDLAQARDEALEHARLKSQFLANMTHEIRTPMNGILGMTGLLQQTNLSPEQRELTESVRFSGKSLVRIIDDILDFSRLEARRLNIDRVPFNLLSVVEDAIELLAESARSQGIELISSVDPSTPLGLLGDSGRLRQVLLNLVGNAIKFTETGEVVLSASLLQEDSTHATIRIDVRDTGIGIGPETQKKLFTAFMQGDGSTTRKYGGTGLGLAICKELVELMDGKISVESELGKGSTFRTVFKLEKDPEGKLFIEAGRPDWKGRKILVIDDNAEQRALLCRQLTHFGFDCVELAQGSKAPQMLSHEAEHDVPFAAVFVDADAPPEEARQLINKLATAEGRNDTSIVAMPFDFLSEDLQPLRIAGVDEFLPKPIRQSQLYTLLNGILNQSPAKEAESSPASSVHPLQGLRFLIVTAHDEKAATLGLLLRSLGSSVYHAATGSKAIQSLQLIQYDAIFFDPFTANEDPVILLQQITELQHPEDLTAKPIVGIGDRDWQNNSLYLREPFEAGALLNVMLSCRLLAKNLIVKPQAG